MESRRSQATLSFRNVGQVTHLLRGPSTRPGLKMRQVGKADQSVRIVLGRECSITFRRGVHVYACARTLALDPTCLGTILIMITSLLGTRALHLPELVLSLLVSPSPPISRVFNSRPHLRPACSQIMLIYLPACPCLCLLSDKPSVQLSVL